MVLAGVLAIQQLTQQRPELLRTNSVFAAEDLPVVKDKPVCSNGELIPGDARELRVVVSRRTPAGSVLRAKIAVGGVVLTGSTTVGAEREVQSIPLEAFGEADALAARGAVAPRTAFGSVCLIAEQRVIVRGTDVPRLAFYSGREVSALSQLSRVAGRAALFKPGWVGAWTFYVLASLVIATFLFAIYALIRHGQGGWSRRRWLTLVALVVLANGFTWSVVTPAFQAPDEYEHFAYVDTLAERGLPNTEAGKPPGAYTERFRELLDTTVFGVALYSQNKPPWFKSEELRWQARDRLLRANDDASGVSSAAQYTPAYYYTAVIPYALGGSNLITKDWLIRLYSVLLTMIAAALAFLTARELAPKIAWFAPVVGLVAAFEPMFLHIGAAAHIDALETTLITALIYVVARVMRRGVTTNLGIAGSLLFAAAAIVKPSALALTPALLVAAGFLLSRDKRGWRRPLRELAPGAVIAVLAVGAAYLLYGQTASTANSIAGGERETAGSLSGLFSYGWQFFLPRLGFMNDWFGADWYAHPPPVVTTVLTGFTASFNHVDTLFPFWVYRWMANLFIVMGIATLFGAWRFRDRYREWLPFAAFAVAAVCSMVGFLIVSTYLLQIKSGGFLMQGRYLLPFITIAGLFVAVSAYSVSRRWGFAIAANLVVCLGLLNLFSYALSLSRFYL